MCKRNIELVVTDLDDTLWNWFETWHTSFSALLRSLVQETGIAPEILLNEAKLVHQRRRTSEYSFLLDEMPTLVELASPIRPSIKFEDSYHEWNSKRFHTIGLYPGVESTLRELKKRGIGVVAYTESQAFWTDWRIIQLDLDGEIDTIYSLPDHDIPPDVDLQERRMKPADEYTLSKTRRRHTPDGEYKPSRKILEGILSDQKVSPENTLYVGDSLMKDVAMAKDVGTIAAFAKYGTRRSEEQYELLRRVTHWTDKDVEKERSYLDHQFPCPDLVLHESFAELLDHI